ncbi:glutamine synthetase [Natribaculum luteum]|uniref:Glutamine synthetase n=1 Tax=Natribaculum luteum TaxID=1586232 RepID=A0ABD5P3K2_9EURY|nr:glutamine synthetase [Natribaculum luteum]
MAIRTSETPPTYIENVSRDSALIPSSFSRDVRGRVHSVCGKLDVLVEVLGDEFVHAFTIVKHHELDLFNAETTEWKHRYFEVL